MKQDFLNYIKQEFNFSEENIKNLEKNLSKPLKKSIRVNTNKISIDEFKKLAEKNNWILTKTSLGKNTFYIDRDIDLDTALGNTLEHINGYFYVQEVAASSSPYYMSGDKIDNNNYLILDMSASPGGKTTQLSEYYPNSIIVANEIDKQRLKGFFINLDRMSSLNVVATNYDGRNFKNQEELFDKVLLDAPCSGEGTAYKTDDSLKYWNIKNIKAIVKLQLSLLDSAMKSVKVGGEIVYSTCTLNKLENELVIEEMQKRYPDSFEIIHLEKKGENLIFMEGTIRNWPHIDNTGGFFVAKLKKIKSIIDFKLEQKYNKNNQYLSNKDLEEDLNKNVKKEKPIIQNYEKVSSKDCHLIENFFEKIFGYKNKDLRFFKYKNEISVVNKNIDNLWKKIFLYKIGVKIGKIENGEFEPDFNLGIIELFEKNIEIGKESLKKLFCGEDLDLKKDDGFYQISIDEKPAGIIKIKNSKAKSLIGVKIK